MQLFFIVIPFPLSKDNDAANKVSALI